MCLLVLVYKTLPGWPLVAGANRDEAFARESLPFEVLATDGRVPVLAPRDRRHGGTWIGINATGLFAAITNRPGTPHEDRRSRGLLCLEALGRRDADSARDFVDDELSRQPFNPFNLVLADSRSAYVVSNDLEAGTRIETLAPGLHVVSNHGDANTVLFDEIRRRYDPVRRLADLGLDERLSALSEITTDRVTQDAQGRTISKNNGERGTVSTTLLLAPDEQLERGRLLFADDTPFPSDFTDRSGLLADLVAREGS